MTDFTLDNVTRPIQEGDSGVIIGNDGKFFIFNTHIIDPANLTPMQRAHGEAIDALSTALRLPQVMDMLKRIANDPSIVKEATVH